LLIHDVAVPVLIICTGGMLHTFHQGFGIVLSSSVVVSHTRLQASAVCQSISGVLVL
jgi:hypothetical protein